MRYAHVGRNSPLPNAVRCVIASTAVLAEDNSLPPIDVQDGTLLGSFTSEMNALCSRRARSAVVRYVLGYVV